MRSIYLALTAALLLLSACRAERAGIEEVTLALPIGDEAAGRQAFLDLHCYSCHIVEGEDLPDPISEEPAPSLGSLQTRQSSGQVATSIVVPEHAMAQGRAIWRVGELSRMGSYSEAMSVQQLIDLVAYLRGWEDE